MDSHPNAVSHLIRDRSEQTIAREVQRLGVDTVLGWVFDLIAAAFIPEASMIDSAVVQFEITASDGIHFFQLNFAEGKCAARKGNCDDARLTISLALPVFLRIVGGELEGLDAFVSGNLRLRGDVLLAQAMRGWFHRESVVAIAL